MERSAVGCVVGVLMIAGGVAPVGAQTGGGYDLSRNVIAGGGATFSTGGNLSLGGTAGQADAGTLTGSPYSVSGGFWGALLSAPTATPTPTNTPTNSPTNTPTLTPSSTRTNTPTNTPRLTPTPTVIPTATATPSNIPTRTPTNTASPTPSVTPSSTRTNTPTNAPTRTPTPTPTASPTPTAFAVSTVTASVTPTLTVIACVGDCNGDGQVTVDELLTMVNIALGNAPVAMCEAGDANHDGQITVDEILAAVNNALNGCSEAEQACVGSGGTISTSLCCGGVGDFPNTCSIGACGCSPQASHEVQICNCGAGKCFGGASVGCVTD